MFQGFGLSCLLALFVLFLGTNNWMVSLACCSSVACVIIMLFGILGLSKYNLGMHESIDFSVVIAVAMSYFTPLACAYSTANAVDRGGRIRKALEAVGSAIVLGMF